ncbi:NAC domain-containing protein 104-like [Punica granatum]|uniref:NAC domain-containing protein 104-like n=1 Tax=Punica granatum TaxID=22663 RepID=A0A6P8EAA5_PUNGR|nr:NAC domain-containing protein 104-like [Punica granatum]
MDEAARGRSCSLKLPPGFRFSPTDEELILHFLYPKSSSSASSSSSSTSSLFSYSIIPDLLAFQPDPWELNGKAIASGNQYFYFSRQRQNRSTSSGYWKDLEMEEPIFSRAANGIKIGTKKLLVFHIGGGRRCGAAIEGEETNWVMEEYRLIPRDGSTVNGYSHKRFGNQRQEHGSLVLCRVHERKNYGSNQRCYRGNCDDCGSEISSLDEMFMALDDDLDDVTSPC